MSRDTSTISDVSGEHFLDWMGDVAHSLERIADALESNALRAKHRCTQCGAHVCEEHAYHDRGDNRSGETFCTTCERPD